MVRQGEAGRRLPLQGHLSPAEGAVLCLDTATDDTCVGACRGARVLYESHVGAGESGRPRHGEALLPALEEAADAAGGWESVSRVTVGVGPGSFTGLRIGIATARGAAAAAGAELSGVGTLDVLARPAFEPAAGRPVLATIDARRGQLFASLQDPDDRIWDPFVADPADVVARLSQAGVTPLAVGSGAVRFRGELETCAEIPQEHSDLHRVDARQLCALAHGAEPGPPPEPLYLRPPDAERWRDRNASNTSPA